MADDPNKAFFIKLAHIFEKYEDVNDLSDEGIDLMNCKTPEILDEIKPVQMKKQAKIVSCFGLTDDMNIEQNGNKSGNYRKNLKKCINQDSDQEESDGIDQLNDENFNFILPEIRFLKRRRFLRGNIVYESEKEDFDEIFVRECKLKNKFNKIFYKLKNERQKGKN